MESGEKKRRKDEKRYNYVEGVVHNMEELLLPVISLSLSFSQDNEDDASAPTATRTDGKSK